MTTTLGGSGVWYWYYAQKTPTNTLVKTNKNIHGLLFYTHASPRASLAGAAVSSATTWRLRDLDGANSCFGS
jgi:hypothetical protein